MKPEKKQIIKIAIIAISVLIVALFAAGIIFVVIGIKTSKNHDNNSNIVENIIDSVNDSNDENKTVTDTDNKDSASLFDGVVNTSSVLNTGNLTSIGSGYEGTKGSGKYNYGEALQKSLLFYELQRSGDLPEDVRCNWRGDSCLTDGADNNIDLSGGWYDAGDNVKFNLPMSYSASVLGWSVYNDYDAYVESGQLEYALANIKWANDYFIKCHPSDEVYYYQVGDGNQDHSWWGPAEIVDVQMNRPSYCVTKDNPGSAVTGETSASLAICSILYKDIDEEYSKFCLSHAKSLYKFSRDTLSDDGYTAANGFYNSWSGYYDELAWAGVWLYLATDDEAYLNNAKSDYDKANQDYNWSMCWDDVHIGAATMLSEVTGEKKYSDAVEKHLDWWTTGTSEGERITYTPKGLAWLDSWGSLRYATTTAFVASVYAESDACSEAKKKTYEEFALSQANYALGDTGFSYEIGFGNDYPVNPHHRTAQGSSNNNMNEPNPGKHVLYGALVGGPDASDGYTDTVNNYNTNEVACDYNAGFTGLLANLYSKYKGQTLKDFGAVEAVGREIHVDGGINVDGDDFVEIKAYVYNETAWPARIPEKLELRYFLDLSEVYNEGQSASDIVVTTNYMQSGRSDGLKVWDEEKHIYYLSVIFDDKNLYPGGQEHYKQEIQVRMRNEKGVWDDSNDPSYAGLSKGSMVSAENMALYENDVLVFGTEPPSGENAGQSILPTKDNATISDKGNNGSSADTSNNNADNNNSGNNSNNNNNNNTKPVLTAKNENIEAVIEYTGDGGNSISGSLKLKNVSDESIDLSKVDITYIYTQEGSSSYVFDKYHSAINGDKGAYSEVKNVNGTISDISGNEKKCVITFPDSQVWKQGEELVLNFALHPSDWGQINTANDYSYTDVSNIVIKYDGKIICGKEK